MVKYSELTAQDKAELDRWHKEAQEREKSHQRGMAELSTLDKSRLDDLRQKATARKFRTPHENINLSRAKATHDEKAIHRVKEKIIKARMIQIHRRETESNSLENNKSKSMDFDNL